MSILERPNLLSSIRVHYRKIMRSETVWMGNSETGFYHSYDPKHLQEYKEQFTRDEWEAITEGNDIRPTPSRSSTTKRIAKLLTECNSTDVRRIIEELTT